MPSTVFLCTGCVLDPTGGGFGAGVPQITRKPPTEGARGFEGAPGPVGVAEDPGRRWGFLPGRGGVGCVQLRNREVLLRVATLEEDYFDEDANYAVLVKYRQTS